jgi:hypothetical protein
MNVSRYQIASVAAVALTAVLTVVGCRHPSDQTPPESEATGPAWFEEIAATTGLEFVHDAGPTGNYFLPQVMGSGVALFDCDRDGRLAVYLVQNGGPNSKSVNRLFRQRSDGRFDDISAGSGLDVAGFGMGVAIGDINNDGLPDVLLTQYSGGCRLFLNQGKGHFTEVTSQLGSASPLWGTSACFFDYDRDGWLDLVVSNFVDYDPSAVCPDLAGRRDFCHPNTFSPAVSKLYRNLGVDKDGRWRGFQDATLESGLGSLRGNGLGVVCADFDGDGWPDIFIANDSRPNHLWINQHNGTFREEGVSRGVAYNGLAQAQANMGIALGDIDGDGLFDLYVTHTTEQLNALWQQGPSRGTFQDRTAATGLAMTRWRGTGFGTVLGDFDHDGALDLALVNGRVQRGNQAPAPPTAPFWSRYAERNQLLTNDGHGRFRDISPQNPALCGTPGVYRGLAMGDLFNRGTLDLVVTEAAGPARIYRNVAPNKGHWLVVSALEPRLGGRDAYGSVITVQAGNRRWLRWLNPGYSYLCSNDPRVHFGLGAANRVDWIRVLWPDGQEEEFPGQGADQWVRLEKGKGTKVAEKGPAHAREK